MADVPLKDLLDCAQEAAWRAGQRTLAYFNTGVDIEVKSDDTPVTVADKEAETVIRNYVKRHFPTHSVLGEEHPDDLGDPNYKWILDPIDGTKSFIHGVPLYGTLIGVEVHGVCRVGVLHLPALKDMIAAADGEGCTWNGRATGCSKVTELKDATILAGSITRAIDRSNAYEKLARNARLNRGWGDAYGYALVATGRAEAMLDPKISPWDCACMPPIFREAGGWCGTWAGEETIYGKDFLACAGGMKDLVLEATRHETRRK
ncbi:MAG: inositol monophosphatase family protein [Phycisphaerae bacterium]